MNMKPSTASSLSNKSDKSLPSPRSRIPRRSSLPKSDILSGSQSSRSITTPTTTTNTTYVLDSGENSRAGLSGIAGRTYTTDSQKLSATDTPDRLTPSQQVKKVNSELTEKDVTLADYLCAVDMTARTADTTNQTLDADSTLRSDQQNDSLTTSASHHAVPCDQLISIDKSNSISGSAVAAYTQPREYITGPGQTLRASPGVNLINFSSTNNTLVTSGTQQSAGISLYSKTPSYPMTPNMQTQAVSVTSDNTTGVERPSAGSTPLLISLSGDRSITTTPKALLRSAALPTSQILAEQSHDSGTAAASQQSYDMLCKSAADSDWQAVHSSMRQTTPRVVTCESSLGHKYEAAADYVPSSASQQKLNLSKSNTESGVGFCRSINSTESAQSHQTSNTSANMSAERHVSVGEPARPLTPLTDPADYDPLRTSSRISDVIAATPPVTPNMPRKTSPVKASTIIHTAVKEPTYDPIDIKDPTSDRTSGKGHTPSHTDNKKHSVNITATHEPAAPHAFASILPNGQTSQALHDHAADVDATDFTGQPVRELEQGMERSLQQLKQLAESYDTSSGSESLPTDIPYSRGDDVTTQTYDDVSMHENTRPISPIGLISDLTITGRDREGGYSLYHRFVIQVYMNIILCLP